MSTDVQTLERDKALAEVVRHRGTQFDPAVVDAFCRVNAMQTADAAE
jgi:HD-GYP domain-containing protein (c-di-GMP phosphodiesterase class II)